MAAAYQALVPFEARVAKILEETDVPLTVDEIAAALKSGYRMTVPPNAIAFTLTNTVGVYERVPNTSPPQWKRAGTQYANPYHALDDLPSPDGVSPAAVWEAAVILGECKDPDRMPDLIERLRQRGVTRFYCLTGHSAGRIAAAHLNPPDVDDVNDNVDVDKVDDVEVSLNDEVNDVDNPNNDTVVEIAYGDADAPLSRRTLVAAHKSVLEQTSAADTCVCVVVPPEYISTEDYTIHHALAVFETNGYSVCLHSDV